MEFKKNLNNNNKIKAMNWTAKKKKQQKKTDFPIALTSLFVQESDWKHKANRQLSLYT